MHVDFAHISEGEVEDLMMMKAAFALVFVCLLFPFTCTAEEPRPGPIETVQVQSDRQAEIKAEPAEGAGPVPGDAPARAEACRIPLPGIRVSQAAGLAVQRCLSKHARLSEPIPGR